MSPSLAHERIERGQELAASSERRGGVLPLAGLATRESDDVLRGLHELVGARDLRHLPGGMSGELQGYWNSTFCIQASNGVGFAS